MGFIAESSRKHRTEKIPVSEALLLPTVIIEEVKSKTSWKMSQFNRESILSQFTSKGFRVTFRAIPAIGKGIVGFGQVTRRNSDHEKLMADF